MKAHQQLKYSSILIVIFIITSLLLTACGGVQAQDKPFTIGIVCVAPMFDDPIIEGFKTGMAELGYVEGEDVIYLYNGPTGVDLQVIDNEIKNLFDQKVDLLFVIGDPPVSRATQAVAETDMPVVFGLILNPVEFGYVESISHPGGNVTGVQAGAEMLKALEWLDRISPKGKKVYAPYNPDDQISLRELAILEKIAAQLNIELVPGEVHSVEEAVAAIESLPEDIGAILRISAPTLDPRSNELSQAAIKRGLPTGAYLPLDEAMLLTLAIDLVETGKQGARLAHQIRQGAKPADLPVETSEFYLTLNLKTAEAIGLDIPDEILRQADTIIR
jgi:putative ABC transport system substrate-binding protein